MLVASVIGRKVGIAKMITAATDGHGRDNDSALGVGHVNGGADRGLQRDAEQTAGCGHQPDVGLGPVLARDEKDVDEGSEKVSDVGREEVQRIERVRNGQHRLKPLDDSMRSPAPATWRAWIYS
jgi:hypothetical protein